MPEFRDFIYLVPGSRDLSLEDISILLEDISILFQLILRHFMEEETVTNYVSNSD